MLTQMKQIPETKIHRLNLYDSNQVRLKDELTNYGFMANDVWTTEEAVEATKTRT